MAQPEIWKTHQLRVVGSWNPPWFFCGFDAYQVVLWDFWTINSSGDGFVQQNNPTNSVDGLDLKMSFIDSDFFDCFQQLFMVGTLGCKYRNA